MTPKQFYAANVQRWHHHPNEKLRTCGDNIKDHQKRCVYLAWDFVPDIYDDLESIIMFHDQAEVLIGDLAYTAKRDFPDLADAWSDAEAEIIGRHNIPQPSNEWEHNVLKFVDNLDAYMTVRKYAPEELHTEDWKAARRWLLEMCWHLGFDMDLLCDKIGGVV